MPSKNEVFSSALSAFGSGREAANSKKPNRKITIATGAAMRPNFDKAEPKISPMTANESEPQALTLPYSISG